MSCCGLSQGFPADGAGKDAPWTDGVKKTRVNVIEETKDASFLMKQLFRIILWIESAEKMNFTLKTLGFKNKI